jgi:hypothetical protein
VKVGDLVKYMSRIVLIVDICPNDAAGNKWIFGIECGETEIGKYRQSVLKVLSESR